MNNKELRRIVTLCFDDDRYAILKALQARGKMSRIYLREFLEFQKTGAAFAYHLRSLAKLQIIIRNDDTHTFELTARGVKILKMIETFLKEKYISEDSEEICMNTSDGVHQFVPVCRKCSYVKKEKQA